MTFHLTPTILLIGILVFFSRVIDVSIGTLRTISIVQGRTKIAFLLGFIEVSMWLVVLSVILPQIKTSPIIGFFYAIGFSTGNVVGIILERKIALGQINIRIITSCHAEKMTEAIRGAGYAVTTFQGNGLKGEVTLIYVVSERKNLKQILSLIKSIDPNTFYIIDHTSSVSKLYKPNVLPKTGWRAIFKKK